MTEADMDRLVAEHEATSAIAKGLMEKDPRLPFISALVIAGDLQSLERSKRWVLDGTEPFGRAMMFVGSYGRFEFALWGIEHGHTTEAALIEDLPSLWSGSDPDDTDPRALALWQGAHRANGGRYVRDGRPLPRGARLRVYRGQDGDAPLGIAWTTDRAVAEKFARGAATRQGNRGGSIIEATIPRNLVLAYVTGRNEDEVIFDPAALERRT